MKGTMAQMAQFSFPYYFTVPNSKFRILNRPFLHCYLPKSQSPLPSEISRYFTRTGQTVDKYYLIIWFLIII